MNHVFVSYGRKSDRDESVKGTKKDCSIQRPCTVCGKKTNHYCTRAECKGHHRARNMAPPYLALQREVVSLLMCAAPRAYQRTSAHTERAAGAVRQCPFDVYEYPPPRARLDNIINRLNSHVQVY